MSNFNPTHEFRGLELELDADETFHYGLAPFRDEQGYGYYFPEHLLTKLQPKPKPGEVYASRISPDAGPGIRIIDDQGQARDRNGTVVARAGTVAGFIEDGDYKLLVKADGTKA